jgi:hypothetical protein
MDFFSEPYPRFPCRGPLLSANADALRRSTWTNFHIFIALIWNFSKYIHLYGLLQFLNIIHQNSHGIFWEFSSPDFLINFCWIWQEGKAWNLLSFHLVITQLPLFYPHEATMCKSMAFYKGADDKFFQLRVSSCPSLSSKSCFKERLLPIFKGRPSHISS